MLYKGGDKEKLAFQDPMECRKLIWDDGIPHGRCTKMEDGEQEARKILAEF